MAIRKNGKLTTTIPGQFDGQIHSIEWFYNGAWRRIIDTVYPLQDAEILDDTLDCGGFCFINELEPYPDEWETDASGNVITDADGNKIENTNSIKFLKQLTPIRILWDSNEDYKSITDDMTAAQKAEAKAFNEDLELQIRGKKPVKDPIWRYRVVDEINIHGEGRIFKFAVKTVEATKLLELVQCDTLTFTKKLGREVDLNAGIKSEINTGNNNFSELVDEGVIKGIDRLKYQSYHCSIQSNGGILTPVRTGTSIFIPIVTWWYYAPGHRETAAKIDVTLVNLEDDSEQYLFTYDRSWGMDQQWQIDHYKTIEEEGNYAIRYKHVYWGCYVELYVAVVSENTFESIPSFTRLSISNVLDRILIAGETRRDGIEQQRFVLDASINEKFLNYHSPEFCITRATMWEALKMVAGHVHCIPRLNWDETTNSFRLITFDELGGMEECQLKTMHNNKPIAWDVRKSLDSYCGEINTYVDNLVNTKDEAMGTIVEPYAGGWKSARASDGELIVSDDTVVFNMSRPNMRVSKLEIKYGDKEADITKYLFEAAEYKALSTFEGTYPHTTAFALKVEQGGTEINRLEAISKDDGVLDNIDAIFKYPAIKNIADQFGIDLEVNKLNNILYRITYSPISSARIIQKKPYIEDCTGYSRNYNVAGNMIESEYLGEHLKGAIARVGNDIEYRTYMFERAKDVPKAGTILDGKYIMKVTTEMSTVRFIKATLVLSSDYNQKHEYVAIDSSIRYYDVSEKQSVERHINYSEDVIIGDEMPQSNNSPMMTSVAVELFAKAFSGEAVNKQVTWVWFRGTSKKYEGYIPMSPSAVLLPCLSQAEGNSLIFNFACEDNYSAGWRIGKILGNGICTQTQVPYSNVYGEFERLDLIFGNAQDLKGISLPADMPKKLPLWTSSVKPVGLFSTGENPLIISKDSREQLNFTYQLNSVANRKSIILGTALNSDNPLVTATKARTIVCYWLPHKINKFATTIDVSNGAAAQFEVMSDNSSLKFYLQSIQNASDIDAEAIVWVDVTNGEHNAKLIIGENLTVKIGSFSKDIWFNFNANK